jgi:TPR repeat protein
MKNLTRTICLTLAILLGSLVTGCGADFDKGLAAYESGDFATALREWRPLAEQGNADAQFNLGVMYYKGRGVPKNYKTAVKWYTLAAEQGNASAQFYLGVMYRRGKGVPKNYKTALKWYTLAAEQGHAFAQFGLGIMYDHGQGVPQDPVYAHMWMQIAEASGYENASKNRNIVAKQMTATQIEKAQKLASECIAKKYKGC